MSLAALWTPMVAQETRPVKDDVGFCWDSAQMDRLMVCGENTLLRELYEIPADLVVLGLGLREDPGNLDLFQDLGVRLDREGLIESGTEGDPEEPIDDDEEPGDSPYAGAAGAAEGDARPFSMRHSRSLSFEWNALKYCASFASWSNLKSPEWIITPSGVRMARPHASGMEWQT